MLSNQIVALPLLTNFPYKSEHFHAKYYTIYMKKSMY